MLSTTSRALTGLLAVLYALLGLVLFVAPGWSAPNFAWSVSPFVAMTMGGWCLGTAVYAGVSARVWRWSVVHPCLVYLWAFGVLEAAVVVVHRNALRLGVLMAWPYLLVVGLTVVAAVLGILDWARLRPAAAPEGLPVPWWVRGLLIGFVAIVSILGLLLLPRTTPTQGGIFPDRLTVFTVRAFGAFYAALAIAAIPALFARRFAPILAFTWTGVALIGPILAAAIVHLDRFDFVARPDGLIYVGAYVVALLGALLFKGYERYVSPPRARGGVPAGAPQ
jgi:hypothetical protein